MLRTKKFHFHFEVSLGSMWDSKCCKGAACAAAPGWICISHPAHLLKVRTERAAEKKRHETPMKNIHSAEPVRLLAAMDCS